MQKATDKQNRSGDNVALFILRSLKDKEGIDHIFLAPGFLVDPFLPKFSEAGIRPIIAAHEGGAAYMADGYARASRNFGVCMGIGGPGVTNMVTAIASAYGDRSPVLVIGGKISPEYEGKGAFQDSSGSSGIDDMAIMRTVTEFSATIPKAESAGIFLRKAIRVVRDVESLPVFLSIPKNIQEEAYTARPYVKVDNRPHRILDLERAEEIASILTKATRIAIFAGNGTVRSGAGELLEDFVEKFSIPVVTTMRAKGAVREHKGMSFGVFGFGGSLRANKLIAGPKDERPEVVLVLGATLNENNTFEGEMPRPEKKLILLDINPNSNRDIEYDHEFIMADVQTFLKWMLAHTEYHKALYNTQCDRKKWANKIRDSTDPFVHYDRGECRGEGIHPGKVIDALRKAADENGAFNTVLVVDSGAHSFFAGHYWTSYEPNEFLLMTTMGPMGYGVAAGIGAQLAQRKIAQEKKQPERPVVCVVGDGGMLMHGIELQTAVRNQIPLIVIVINNGAHGNVFLRFAKNNDLDGMKLASIEPRHNWEKFAKSLGAKASKVSKAEELAKAYRKAFTYTRKEKKPYLVDVICDKTCKTPNMLLTVEDGRRSLGIETKKAMHPWFG